jgi:hypothetical protein
MREAAEKALQIKFRECFRTALQEKQESGLILINPSQEVGQRQMVMMPLLYWAKLRAVSHLPQHSHTW